MPGANAERVRLARPAQLQVRSPRGSLSEPRPDRAIVVIMFPSSRGATELQSVEVAGSAHAGQHAEGRRLEPGPRGPGAPALNRSAPPVR